MLLGYDPEITIWQREAWGQLPDNPAEKLSEEARSRDGVNAREVDDWLPAIAEGREQSWDPDKIGIRKRRKLKARK